MKKKRGEKRKKREKKRKMKMTWRYEYTALCFFNSLGLCWVRKGSVKIAVFDLVYDFFCP